MKERIRQHFLLHPACERFYFDALSGPSLRTRMRCGRTLAANALRPIAERVHLINELSGKGDNLIVVKISGKRDALQR